MGLLIFMAADCSRHVALGSSMVRSSCGVIIMKGRRAVQRKASWVLLCGNSPPLVGLAGLF